MKSKHLVTRVACALLVFPLLMTLKAAQAQETDLPVAGASPEQAALEARLAPYFSFLDLQIRPPKGYALQYDYDSERTLYTWISPRRPGPTPKTYFVSKFVFEIMDDEGFANLQGVPLEKLVEDRIAVPADVNYTMLAGMKAARIGDRPGVGEAKTNLRPFEYIIRRGKHIITMRTEFAGPTEPGEDLVMDAAARSLRKGPGTWSILTGKESDNQTGYNFELAPAIAPGPPTQLGPPVKFNRYQINPPFNYELVANETPESSTYEWRGPLRTGGFYMYETGLNTSATLKIEVIETPSGHALHNYTAEQYFYERISLPEIANWRYAVDYPASGTFGTLPAVFARYSTVPKEQPKHSENYVWRGLLYVVRDGDRLIVMQYYDGFRSADEWQPEMAAAMSSFRAVSPTPVTLPAKVAPAAPVPVVAVPADRLGEATEIFNLVMNPPAGYTVQHKDDPLGESYTLTAPAVGGAPGPNFQIALWDVGDTATKTPAEIVKGFLEGEAELQVSFHASKIQSGRLGALEIAYYSYTRHKHYTTEFVRGFNAIVRSGDQTYAIFSKDTEPSAAVSQPLLIGSVLTLRPANAQ